MGTSILRGIRAALIVTVIMLVIGMLWTTMKWQGLTMSLLVDIGLILSCAFAGYVSGRDAGVWFVGGITGICYVGLLVGAVSLFVEISGWGAVQILGEGGLIGLITGGVGASGVQARGNSYGEGWHNLQDYSSNDTHLDDWKDYDYEDDPRDDKPEKKQKEKILWTDRSDYGDLHNWFDSDKDHEDNGKSDYLEQSDDLTEEFSMEHRWNEPKEESVKVHKKAWWDEDVL